MFVRIFFLGMIAIASGQNDATVLVPKQAGHTAYLGFDPGVCTAGCGRVKLDGSTVDGVPLQGFKIKLSPITDSQAPALSFALGRIAGTDIPGTPAEAADFTWIASIPKILQAAGSGGDGNAAHCVSDPGNCGHPLAAEMPLTLGALQTCGLIPTPGGFFQPDMLHVFDYVSGSPTLPGQALASAAALVTSMTQGDLSLELSNFGDANPVKTLTLHPVKCQDQPASMCIDVFVGNVTPEDLQNPMNIETAPHFKEFFGLLDSSSAVVVTPTRNHHKSKPVVQPVCRHSFPGIPNSKPKFKLANLFVFFFRSTKPATPFSRPICPLAVVAE